METWVKESVENGLRKLGFGEIRLLIHEGTVVSIDTIERRRVTNKEIHSAVSRIGSNL